jgi:hypothetical protein
MASWQLFIMAAILPGISAPADIGGAFHCPSPCCAAVESFSAPDRGLVRTGIDLFAGVRMLGVSVTEHSLAVGTPLTCVGELSKAPSWCAGQQFLSYFSAN